MSDFDWELFDQVRSAEEYAERRLKAMSPEQRQAALVSDAELLEMMKGEYAIMYDSRSGSRTKKTPRNNETSRNEAE